MAVPILKFEYLKIILQLSGEADIRSHEIGIVNNFQNKSLLSSIRSKINGDAAVT